MMLIASALVMFGVSYIFKLVPALRIFVALGICIGLVVLLIGGLEQAIRDAKIASPTKEEARDAFIDQAIEKAPWMSREDFE